MRVWKLPGLLASCLVAIVCSLTWAANDDGLVAHWNFDEAAGTTLRDQSPNAIHGAVHGAQWVKCGKGYALQFRRPGDYVDFGDHPRLKLSGDVTLAAWVKLAASPYPDRTTNWYILGSEAYRKSGFGLRVDGAGCKLYYRASQAGTFQHGSSQSPLLNNVFYHAVLVKRKSTATLFINGVRDIQFSAEDPAPGSLPFTISNQYQPFRGLIDDVKIYNTALPVGELIGLYKEGCARLGLDASWFGKVDATPFFYFDDDNLLLDVNLRGILPLKKDEHVTAELGPPGQAALVRNEVAVPLDSARASVELPLDDLPKGAHEIRVLLERGPDIKPLARIPFHYPPLPVSPPSPEGKIVAALPPLPEPVRYKLNVSKGGGFQVGLNGRSYPVESTFSYPHGGENSLTATGGVAAAGEAGWSVRIKKVDASTHRVIAAGKHYRINRVIKQQPTHILVHDKITNLADGDLGIILSNHIRFRPKQGAKAFVPSAPNPPGFVHTDDHGLGILPLDDVYQVQQKTYVGDGVCGVRDGAFGLAKGASYTLEWAVYPVGSNDYYDLVNVIRKDQGLDNRTVDGCMSITHSGRWLRESPPKELVQFAGLGYTSSGCVTHIADDPGLSIEGFEFIQYPKERAALKKTYVDTKTRFPQLKVMFHVAHSLYVTNKPEETFPDSRIIAKSGKHEMYNNSLGYFSAERRDEGYAWYPYYPTLDNSFGKAMLRSVDVMMDEIGTDGVFADGLIGGYGAASGNYPTTFVCTYGPWDGHTVEIDPGTKTIARKLGSVVLLGQDALIAYMRKIKAKGGRVVTNHMNIVPRTLAKEDAIYCAETNDGDYRCASLHLAPTVIGLANPNKMGSAQIIYDDIRSKLAWGALYFYYYWAGTPLTRPFITTEMYPITVTEIRPGLIRGRERIITANGGVYGWRDNRDLHFVHLSDAKGRMVPSSFLTTVDSAGVRTEIVLRENEIAVVERIPITIKSRGPVNLVALKYDVDAIKLVLSGKGTVTLTVRDGPFPVKPGRDFNVTIEESGGTVRNAGDALSTRIKLSPRIGVTITPVTKQERAQ